MPHGDQRDVGLSAQCFGGEYSASVVLGSGRANLLFFVLLRFVFNAVSEVSLSQIGYGSDHRKELSFGIFKKHRLVGGIGRCFADDRNVQCFEQRIGRIQQCGRIVVAARYDNMPAGGSRCNRGKKPIVRTLHAMRRRGVVKDVAREDQAVDRFTSNRIN